ncbi:MAG: hypothetical protein KGM24_02855, partial [Elusimicrobia bacterium]|nr:hypothetical protein [Elusimicrobiota bacterium]
MERWELRPAPTKADPDRHVLLVRGGPADVAALLKKFGGLLGRPSPHEGDFNLSLYVHRLTAPTRAKLEGWLIQAAPPPAAPPPPEPAEPAPPPESVEPPPPSAP